MKKIFVCNAGRYEVEITDNSVEVLINKIDKWIKSGLIVNNSDRFVTPNHPFDYIEIAYALCMDDVISGEDYEHLKMWMIENALYKS